MNLSPTEVARRFGVSIKALRLYERRGLLKPLRSEAGWRTYGPDQIARLHQILALKGLGLSLASIGQLLASADTLDAVDTVLRHFRQQPLLPFGGVQVLYIGDLYQLPPVVSNQEWELLRSFYASPFFFDAQVIRQSPTQ